MPIILKFPAYPQELNYASEDSMNAEVATWKDKFVVHVGNSPSEDGEHLAFTSPPSITTWVFMTIVFIILLDVAQESFSTGVTLTRLTPDVNNFDH